MEPSLVLIGRLLLAAVFATAGLAKLRDLKGSRRAVAEFGVPGRLAPVLGTLLPAAELAVAGALVASPIAAWGALAALSLLLLLAVAIVWNLGRGRAPDCHCFGQLHSSPASLRTVARNLGLAAAAAFVGVGLAEPAFTVAIAGAGIVALLPALPAAWRRLGAAGAGAPEAGAAEREGLPVGTPAPGFRLPALRGLSVTLHSLRAAGRPVLLLFTDPSCGPCIELAPKVARWQRDHAGELTIAVIERRRNGAGQAGTDEHGRRNVLFQRDGEVSDAYRAQGTPSAVLVGAEGRIASPVAGGAGAIERLVAREVNGSRARSPALDRESRRQRSDVLRARRNGGAIGRPLIRRELLVRGAGAWAATSAALAWPLRAVAAVSASGGRRCRGDRDCGPKQKCRGQGQNARCKCTSDVRSDECGRDCTNFAFDDNYCGGCGTSCIPGRTTCVDGDCVGGNVSSSSCRAGGLKCPPKTVCCGEPTDQEGVSLLRCRNLKDDKNHCGRCNRACTEGKRPQCCFGNCRDLHGDPRNCGGCLNRCPKDKPICYRGECIKECPQGLRKCPKGGESGTCGQPSTEICCGGKVFPRDELAAGEKCCDGRIMDTQSDPKNCGDCGFTCSGPFDTGECCNGECCDINADTCCPGGCKNLAQDEENCGGCGVVCGPNEFCRFGTCTCPLGQTCP